MLVLVAILSGLMTISTGVAAFCHGLEKDGYHRALAPAGRL